jgi:hypothetical protein
MKVISNKGPETPVTTTLKSVQGGGAWRPPMSSA